MSKYVSKRIASVGTRNGTSLWYLLEDAEGEEKKVSPAGFYRTPVPDVTTDYVKAELLKQLLSKLTLRDIVGLPNWGPEVTLDEKIDCVRCIKITRRSRWD